MLFKAIEFAAKAHTGQFRKGSRVPYIIHPLQVGKILIEANCEEEIIIAGILHDTVEDTPVELIDIEKLFGKRVADLVAGASEPNKSDSWENRKQHTINFLKTAPMDVVQIMLADKLDNIRTTAKEYQKVGEEFWNRFKRPRPQQKWYHESLRELFFLRIQDEPFISLVKTFDQLVQSVFCGNNNH
ncbi:bifunctional (p)ppGpp synthetase/guanosine-3',5'-bis(diphosphate) 3'-pyrophosphohydrolase [candidate division KSB1 bacterium]|nr:bifunctional (p)ppGpp synthetase/guanosine-3',5'-bis(diphosphate) 3'-pyrophosphohydrolase [candidate division KSB1 bacterium]